MLTKHLVTFKYSILNLSNHLKRLCKGLRLKKNVYFCPMKKTNITDLAKYLNLSPSTISRSLADHQDISPTTKTRVKEAAEFFNYVPNLHARYFRKKNSNLIALILPDVNNFFIPELIRGINDVFNKTDYSIITFFSKDKFDIEKEIINYCISWMVEGVLLSVSDETKNLNHLESLRQSNIPVVLIDKVFSSEYYSLVHIDDSKTAYHGTNFLIEQGCKNILGIFGKPEVKLVQDRITGFRNALTKSNLQFHEPSNILTNSNLDNFAVNFTFLLQDNHYDGCFIMSDELAFLAHPILVDNLLLPDTIKVITISDGQIIGSLRPKIPYIFHSGFDIGTKSAEVLLEHIEDKEMQASNEMLETTLMHN
jgi:LacI family transcriptional regulator